jgi:hypothetical protein
LWEVEAPTFSRQSAHRWRQGCQPYAPAAFYPPGRFLVLISTLSGSWTGDLPVCSIVPQPTTLPRAHRSLICKVNFNKLKSGVLKQCAFTSNWSGKQCAFTSNWSGKRFDLFLFALRENKFPTELLQKKKLYLNKTEWTPNEDVISVHPHCSLPTIQHTYC